MILFLQIFVEKEKEDEKGKEEEEKGRQEELNATIPALLHEVYSM